MFEEKSERMNEAAWSGCEDPRKMLEWIRRRASDRKFRLFACAYWRWDQQTVRPEPGMDGALEFAESWAEEGVRPQGYPSGFRGWHPLLARNGFDSASWTVRGSSVGGREWIGPREHEQHIELLREVFGNPFRPIRLPPHWLSATVVGLAQSAYVTRAFDLLPNLADALEEAGCDHDLLLAHLRSSSRHVLGCWAVDLLLQKE
jgi:hypothetical protein